MFDLVIDGLVIGTFPSFMVAYDKMNTIMQKNNFTLFRIGFSCDATPLFNWHKDEGPYMIVEIRDT